MLSVLHTMMRDDAGSTAIEYGLICALIVLVIIVSIQNLGQSALTNLFNRVAAAMG